MKIQSRTKIALITGAFLATCGIPAAYAQSGGSSPAQSQEQSQPAQGAQPEASPAHKGMRPDLGLSDTQKADMKKIREDTKTQIEAVNGDASLTADQKHDKIRELRRNSRKQMHAVLTPEQREKMKEWSHERHANRKHQMPESSEPPMEKPSPQTAPQQ